MRIETKGNIPCKHLLVQNSNRTNRKWCKICSNLTKTAERPQWNRSGVFIVNFEDISHLSLKFLLWTLCSQIFAGLVWNELTLILSCHRSLSCKNQSIDSLLKSMDWFLYDRDLRHERVNVSRKVYSLPKISQVYIFHGVKIPSLYRTS